MRSLWLPEPTPNSTFGSSCIVPWRRAGRPHAIDEVLDEARPIEVEHLLEITLGLTIAERQRYPPMSSPGSRLHGPRAKGFP